MLTSDTNANQSGSLWHLLLASLCVVMGIQVVRVFDTTLVYALGEDYGQTLAAIPALIVFLSPFLTALIARLIPPRRLLLLALGGLAVVRLAMQLIRAPYVDMILAGVAIFLALVGLAVVLASLSGDAPLRRLAQGVIVGMVIESALNGAFLTWDYVWQPGIVPLITALVVSGLVLIALWQVRADFPEQPKEPSVRMLLPLAALGPLFMLTILFLQNTAFVASSAQVSMETALVVVLVGGALSLGSMKEISRMGLPVRLTAGLLLVVVSALLPIASGVVVIALVLIGQVASAGLLSSLLSFAPPPSSDLRPGVWHATVVVGLGSLVFVLLSILYYISALITLPFSYTILAPIGAVLLLLTALRKPAPMPEDAPDWRLVALPVVLLIIPALLFVTRPTIPAAPTDTASLRLVDYNIHQAINVDGWLDPEATAKVIEAQSPDLVALQEVSRGWVIAGSLDVAEWMSRRLQMPYVYAPGHDYQFGNIVFTRLPITHWSYERLPLLNVPMGRSLIGAEIDLGGDKTLTLINTHLSAYADTESRIPQVQTVLNDWNGASRSLIVGDMNAHPNDGDIALYLQAGLTSAQDATGSADLLTFSSFDPVERIDWIFGTAEISFSDFVIPSTTASDHLPLAVSVTVQ